MKSTYVRTYVWICIRHVPFRGCYVQASNLRGSDIPIGECPHFRVYYVQTSMELGPENVSLLERCPHLTKLPFYTTHTFQTSSHSNVLSIQVSKHMYGYNTHNQSASLLPYSMSKTETHLLALTYNVPTT